MSHVYLNAMEAISAPGRGEDTMRSALWAEAPTGVRATDHYTPGRSLHLGCIDATRPSLDHLPKGTRSRTLALFALALTPELRSTVQARVERHGPTRVAVVLGVSTAGLAEGEAAARMLHTQGHWPDSFDYGVQEMGHPAAFVAQELGLRGPALAVSTACSSSAKAFATAARLLRGGFADAVLVGSGDALSGFTIGGFSALESVSAARCNPMSLNRCGINIGEAVALFVATRDPGPVRLSGWGESSDAHHMSAPEPGGRGAIAAMQQALQRAGLTGGAIDYVNLHGTATLHNDAMESLAVAQVLGKRTAASSTKPLTGHTLAAAGAIEAAIAWYTLTHNPRGHLSPHVWDGVRDPALAPLQLVAPGETLGRPVRHVLSNSFAFGGSNATLVLSRE